MHHFGQRVELLRAFGSKGITVSIFQERHFACRLLCFCRIGDLYDCGPPKLKRRAFLRSIVIPVVDLRDWGSERCVVENSGDHFSAHAAALRGHHARACAPQVVSCAVDDLQLLTDSAHRSRHDMPIHGSIAVDRWEHWPTIFGHKPGKGRVDIARDARRCGERQSAPDENLAEG